MAIWKQLCVVLVLAALTAAGWAWFSPEGAAMLARLGLPAPAPAAAPEGGSAAGNGFGGSGFGGSGFGGPPMVVASAVGEGRANARVSAIGDGRALRSVTIKPLDSGRLVAIDAAAGAEVAAGAVIARLDSDLEEIALERAELVAADAEATWERIGRLRQNGAATDVQEREARLALERAKLERRDAAVALERRTILAPIAGVVGLLPVQAGAQVDPSTEIATIEDRSSLLVEFRVPERVVGQLAVGDAVAAAPLARQDMALEGRVTALDNRIDPASRTLMVQAALPNDDDRLRSGMAFSIEIRLPGQPFPEVAALAIQWAGDGAYVFAARDGRAVRVPVRIVQRSGDRALVAGALAPGDLVVVEGMSRLEDGGPLSLRDAAPAAGDQSAAEAPAPSVAAPASAPGAAPASAPAAAPVSGG